MRLNQFIALSAAILCVPSFSYTNEGKSKSFYFYIYDYGRWANISVASMNKRDDPNEIIETTINNGAGPIVNISRGAYHTDQYNLFLLMFHRALKDHRRTFDPSKATTFFIPYDMASDVAYYKACSKSTGTCFDFRKCPLAPEVELLLEESPWFQRNRGRDHLLLVGNNYAMDHYLGKPRCKSLLAKCYNCSKMAIDDYSFLHSGNDGKVDKGDFWHAVPFPGDFHWSRKVLRPFPWENVDRPILVSYIGSARSYYGPARRLRGSIVHFCERHPNDCVHQSYGKNGTRSSFRVQGHDPLLLSARSVFCFQPIGDLMTRKGLFDGLLQGCIPVVFDPLTATVMYTWHWEEAFWKQVVVDMPHHPVAHRYRDPVVYLKNLFAQNATLVAKKQALIRSRVFELQYSLEGSWEQGGANEGCGGHITDHKGMVVAGVACTSNAQVQATTGITLRKEWPRYEGSARPMRDAFDICIDHALGWHSGTELDFRNATVPECYGKAYVKNNKCVVEEQTSAALIHGRRKHG